MPDPELETEQHVNKKYYRRLVSLTFFGLGLRNIRISKYASRVEVVLFVFPCPFCVFASVG